MSAIVPELGRIVLSGGGMQDVLAATKGKELLYFDRQDINGDAWNIASIPLPENAGTGKGEGVADIDHDVSQDIVFSCEHAEDARGVLQAEAPREVTA